ncbi:hypothetical protein [Leptolyngbya sp. GGD]|nr:hypothetical protein [Leptolyngbya sp. GGD]MCY6493815.1 hypothetical protein [Leptolyngbya sp. GGD]
MQFNLLIPVDLQGEVCVSDCIQSLTVPSIALWCPTLTGGQML